MNYATFCRSSLLFVMLATTVVADEPIKGSELRTPDKIKRRNANPRIRTADDAWKKKHLRWDYKPGNPAMDKILAALDMPAQFEFIDAPLSDVVEFFKDLHVVAIEIDENALSEIGLGTDVPVTKNLKGISLRNGLRSILQDKRLDFVVENDVLLITSSQVAEKRLETHVYETRLLPGISPDKLAEVVEGTVSPHSWKEAGGRGSLRPLPGCLVVYQTQRIHAEIVDLLGQLQNHAENPLFRKTRKRQ